MGQTLRIDLSGFNYVRDFLGHYTNDTA
jgi:hypothetical protein